MSLSLSERVIAYKDGVKILHDWIGFGGVSVDKEQAQARADICLKCPLNDTSWTPTKVVADVIRSQLELKNSLQMRVVGERELGTCSACLCANRLKIWAPLSFLTKYLREDELNRYDNNCWIKSELK